MNLKQKVERYGKSIDTYVPGKRVYVNDRMQNNYSYTLIASYGKDFHEDFQPALSPSDMLELGVFEGKYLNDCYKEFPKEWYLNALKSHKLSEKPNASLNCFNVKSRQSLNTWKTKGWIIVAPGDKDIRGWFQWYCRYYIGRRKPKVDKIQIKRWKSFIRHVGQIRANCKPKDISCRKKQRQALLQWAYDPFI